MKSNGFGSDSAIVGTVRAEAQSNEERLAAALNQMQKILGLKEGERGG